MSKKILSMALAVVMLISVFAFSATAANDTTTFPGDGQIGIRVVSDAYIGMPAGEEVTVKVYYVLPTNDPDYRHGQTNIVIGFNTEYFSFVEGSREFGERYVDAFKETSAAKVNGTYFQDKIAGDLTENDIANGYNEGIKVQQTWSSGLGYSASTGYAVDQSVEIFSLTFTTNKTLDASAKIGVVEGSIDNGQTVLKYRDTDAGKTYTYDDTTAIVRSEIEAVADVTKVNDTATAKMRPGATAGTVDLGITGTVKTKSFDAGKTPVKNASGTVIKHIAANLKEVGVQARINGGTIATATGTNVFETSDGFKFRAAATGIDAAGLGDMIEVRTFIKDKNNNTYYSNWMNINATTVHENAVANDMPGII